MHHSLSTPPTEAQAHRLNDAKAALTAYRQALAALLPAGRPETNATLHHLQMVELLVNNLIIHS